MTKKTTLSGLMEGASRALGYQDIAPGGDFERAHRRAKIAGVNGRLSLSRELLPALMDEEGRITRAPAAGPGGEKMTLAAAAAGYSRVIAAGAHLVRLPDETASAAVGKSGVIALQNRPAGLRLIEAATFGAVALDPLTTEGEITATPLPRPEATIDRDGLSQRAVRFEIGRREQKDLTPEELESEILTSLALGLGRALDAELLAAIIATTPPAYTALPAGNAAAAAALGFRWSELRAIVGTSGQGIEVDNGNLFAGGIPAEITADAAPTVVGAFNRAGVVHHDMADILVERRNAAGDLVVTCWLGMSALIPTPAAFWTVGA